MNVYEVRLIRRKGQDNELAEVSHYVASHMRKVWEILQLELDDEVVEVVSIESRAPILAILE